MADDTQFNGTGGDAQDNQAQMVLQKIYTKDSSFEAPNAPQVFQEIGESEEQPQVQLNLSNTNTRIAENMHEVVLTLTLTCTLGERTAYLAEVHEAGIFGLAGFSQEDEEGLLNTYCPNTLFPYARHIISNMVQDGGFPPFPLQPINFDALYAEQQRRDMGETGAPRLDA